MQSNNQVNQMRSKIWDGNCWANFLIFSWLKLKQKYPSIEVTTCLHPLPVRCDHFQVFKCFRFRAILLVLGKEVVLENRSCPRIGERVEDLVIRGYCNRHRSKIPEIHGHCHQRYDYMLHWKKNHK
jgi:hypothetical protein